MTQTQLELIARIKRRAVVMAVLRDQLDALTAEEGDVA